MSSLEQHISLVYPHSVEIRKNVPRWKINEWCRENAIAEYDLSLLFEKRMLAGWTLRLCDVDDWMIARMAWT